MAAVTTFLDFNVLAIFDLQVTLMLPTKFQVNCLSVQEKKRKIAIFDLQVTPMLPTKFRVSIYWLRGVGGVGF